MRIESLRSEFLIAVLVADGANRRVVRQTLTHGNYRYEVYTDLEFFEEQIQEHIPHVIVVDDMMTGPEPDLMIKSLKSISEDFHIVFLNTGSERKNSKLAISAGADDEISVLSEDGFELTHHIDMVLEKIYLQYQNEQLWDRIKVSEKTLAENLESSEEFQENQTLSHAMAHLSQAVSLEDAVSRFLKLCFESDPGTPVVYLKYVASQTSLVVYESIGYYGDASSTLGFKIKEEDLQNLKSFSALSNQSSTLPELTKFVESVYDSKSFQVMPLKYDRFVRGVVLFLAPISKISRLNYVQNIFRFLEVKCETFSLTKKVEDHIDIDFQTGGPTRRAFLERVETEISRCRRVGHPMSIIIGSIDNFDTVAAHGSLVIQAVSKLIYSQIRKTTRRTDEVAFVGKGEFMVLLPHTTYVGASIKAERIRRSIEATEFPVASLRITMSFGVSEYPTLSTDTDTLIQTALDAVDEVKKVTSNKVCVASSPLDFQPDFIPVEIIDYAKHRALSK